jgi:hypothetical protein
MLESGIILGGSISIWEIVTVEGHRRKDKGGLEVI